MAPRRRRRRAVQEPAEASAPASDLRVLARVFALRFTRGYEYDDRMRFLLGSGFSQAEVASILGMNPTSVRTGLHRMRKRSEKKPRKAKRTKKG